MKIITKITNIILAFLILLSSNIFAYETLTAIKITSNPNKYKDKNVLMYIKFDKIIYENNTEQIAFFEGLNVKGITYKYNLNDEELSGKIKDLKEKDLITIKGKVILEGFNPIIYVHDIVKGWIDTTLLPPTPDEVTIICPNCGHKFKYKIEKDDYKKSILNERVDDTITPIANNDNQDTKEKTTESIFNAKPKQKKKTKTTNGWTF